MSTVSANKSRQREELTASKGNTLKFGQLES